MAWAYDENADKKLDITAEDLAGIYVTRKTLALVGLTSV